MRTTIFRAVLGVVLALGAVPAGARDEAALTARVATVLAAQGPGTRFGLVVATMDGTEIVAIAPDDRFVPASNTKMFTTAAAFETLPDLDRADATGGASVRIDGGDVVIAGHGDARLSSAPDCAVDCLTTLADAVAARTRAVRDVIGDDSAFPDERWSPGMSWNNIATKSGTGISALTVDDNEAPLTVAPATVAGAPAVAAAGGYYTIENRVVTVAGGKTDLRFDRLPGELRARIDGTIAVGAKPETLKLGIDDPARYAAWRFAELLRARGVRVDGAIGVRHRALSPGDDPVVRNGAPAARPPRGDAIATLTPPPLIEDVTLTNKISQNVHAELLLRRVALARGSGSIADGQAVVQAMMARAGVPRWAYDFADGSGMSSYNRVTPRGVVRFLRWTTTRPWAAAWRATLPVAGEGSLRRRFGGSALAGKLFAKTGTLNAASGLAGFMTGASGRTLVFASYAADMPQDASATKAVDAALEVIAAAN